MNMAIMVHVVMVTIDKDKYPARWNTLSLGAMVVVSTEVLNAYVIFRPVVHLKMRISELLKVPGLIAATSSQIHICAWDTYIQMFMAHAYSVFLVDKWSY
eukprot:946406_1